MAEPTGGCHHGNPSTGFKALVSGFDDKCNEGEEEEEEEVCPRHDKLSFICPPLMFPKTFISADAKGCNHQGATRDLS